MLRWVEEMGDQLPPRLKALLNLAITLALVLVGIPFLWNGASAGSWTDGSLGLGLILLGVFNLFT